MCVSSATGVPIGGFLPQVGIALTNEYKDDLDTNAAYQHRAGRHSSWAREARASTISP